MYLPSHFEENRDAVMHALVRAHPFGLLITREGEEPCADAVPFLIDAARGPHGTLVAHVARANPLWRHAQGQRVLVVFQGPQAYVSPSAYPSKAEHGKVVPTWNYAVVHAHGTPRAIEAPDEVLAIVTRLTQTHEAGSAVPWAVSDAPADYIEQMLKAIVGIEIAVERWVGKWKASQNRGVPDRLGTVAGLRQRGGEQGLGMAALVPTDGAAP